MANPDHVGPHVRLGELLVGQDIWWPLVGDPADIAAALTDPVCMHGLPWLDPLATRDKIVAAWREGRLGRDLHVHAPAIDLTVAVVC